MVRDALNRPLKDLRISVTDRCNFRCTYCMPLDQYEWIDKKEILTFEEIERLARLFVQLGADKIRVTGGEPLVRKDLEKLIARLSAIDGLKDLSLTTNGSLLAEKVGALKAAGLRRVNVSIDTLRPERFRQITRRGDLAKVLEGLFAAKKHGLHPIKINAVVERGMNDDEILDLVEFARENGFSIRFIEYMDVGNTNDWTSAKLVPKSEILEKVQSRFPLREVGRHDGTAPSVDYEFADGRGDFGIIASVTEPFCSSCSRARLTADGKLVTCLFSQTGHDLKSRLRRGSTDQELLNFISSLWHRRTDRYSAERLEALLSNAYDPRSHKKIEMITLGG
ncbi:MAG TPA: GTP 3',8-cyclase MoaA [Candidatus Acidoferrales bacterium]|nr:GTP 3',8-cyclase MoaA [Candidatus Acidoferrales bacterium]